MTVSHVVVLAEEPSTEVALRLLVPKVAPGLEFAVKVFQGKHDLLRNLPQRLRWYKSWIPENWRILVVVDCDQDDCRELKKKLERAAADAGLVTKTSAGGRPWAVVNRLAVEELEAWYFGDWEAVKAAYPRVASAIPRKAPFRNPDAIRGGTWEAFERILIHSGCIRSRLDKIKAARAVAEHWEPSRNTSPSFRALCGVLEEIGG